MAKPDDAAPWDNRLPKDMPLDEDVLRFACRSLNFASFRVARAGAVSVLRRVSQQAVDPGVAFDFARAFDFAEAFNFAGVVIPPAQVREELVGFCEFAAQHRPRTVLEIGTAGGGTLFLLTRVADARGTIASVDFARPTRPRGPLYRAFARQHQRVEFLFADSHDPLTTQRVRRIFRGESVDLLFIDGDHSEAGVKGDFAQFGDLVRPGGLIALHDIVPGSTCGGVPAFWQELKDESAVEFVADWNQGGYGIGVIRKT